MRERKNSPEKELRRTLSQLFLKEKTAAPYYSPSRARLTIQPLVFHSPCYCSLFCLFIACLVVTRKKNKNTGECLLTRLF